MTATAPRPAPTRASPWTRIRHRLGRTRRVLRQRPRARRSLLIMGLVVLVVLVGALGRGAVILAAQVQVQTQTVFYDGGNASSIGNWILAPGEIFDFGVEIHNSSNQAVTLRSIELPNGIPAHVQLLHVVYLPHNGMIEGHGWPPPGEMVPLDGAVVPPNGGDSILLALVADRPGTYLIGPVTVNGEVPGPLWSSLHVSHTYRQYAILCPGVTEAQCRTVHAPGI